MDETVKELREMNVIQHILGGLNEMIEIRPLKWLCKFNGYFLKAQNRYTNAVFFYPSF